MAEIKSITIYCERLKKEVTVNAHDVDFNGWENCPICCGDAHGGASASFKCPCGKIHHVELISW